MHLGTGRFWRACGMFLLVVVLIVALAGCTDEGSEQGADEGSGSESAAPEAEKATSPEGYLPPEVVEADCDGCTEVTQDL